MYFALPHMLQDLLFSNSQLDCSLFFETNRKITEIAKY
jgi:hypothetical protein